MKAASTLSAWAATIFAVALLAAAATPSQAFQMRALPFAKTGSASAAGENSCKVAIISPKMVMDSGYARASTPTGVSWFKTEPPVADLERSLVSVPCIRLSAGWNS